MKNNKPLTLQNYFFQLCKSSYAFCKSWQFIVLKSRTTKTQIRFVFLFTIANSDGHFEADSSVESLPWKPKTSNFYSPSNSYCIYSSEILLINYEEKLIPISSNDANPLKIFPSASKLLTTKFGQLMMVLESLL